MTEKERTYQREWARKARRRPEYRKRQSAHRKKNAIKVKISVMQMYGGCCRYCKENELATLTIDHVNDDGCIERRESGITGDSFYRSLLKNDRRQDLQVLCFSCQIRKRFYGPDMSQWKIKAIYLNGNEN